MQHTTSHESHVTDELLSERLDDRLAAVARQRVDQHLDDCAACAARYDGLRATRSALRSLHTVALPRDFRLNVATPVPSSPHPLTRMSGIGFGRLLSAAALICGLLLLAIGLFTFTQFGATTSQMAASSIAAQSAPQAPTSCVASVRCPSVNAGAGISPTPTTTATNSSETPPKTPAPADTSVSPSAVSNSGHNPTLSLLVIGIGILSTLAGIIGLLWGRRPR